MTKSSKFMKESRGFTLVELMITIVILSILLAMAVPSFQQFIAQSRIKSTTSDLLASFFLARSEAIKRNCEVAVKPVGAGWASGWSVETTSGCTATGVVLEQHDSISKIAITASFVGDAKYKNTGRLSGSSSSISLVVTSGTIVVVARCLVVSSSGQANLKLDSDGDASNGCN